MPDNRTPNSFDRPEPIPTSRASGTAAHTVTGGDTTREQVLAREKEQFGGMKFGSAFFGWLTATGTAVILTALLAATGTATLVSAGTPDGTSAEVTVQTQWHPPVLTLFVPDGWTLQATATSRTALR